MKPRAAKPTCRAYRGRYNDKTRKYHEIGTLKAFIFCKSPPFRSKYFVCEIKNIIRTTDRDAIWQSNFTQTWKCFYVSFDTLEYAWIELRYLKVHVKAARTRSRGRGDEKQECSFPGDSLPRLLYPSCALVLIGVVDAPRDCTYELIRSFGLGFRR